MLALLFGALALAVAGWLPRPSLVLAIGVAAAVGGYLIAALFPLSDVLKPVSGLSPWKWALGGDPLVNAAEPWRSVALIVPAFVLVALAAIVVQPAGYPRSLSNRPPRCEWASAYPETVGGITSATLGLAPCGEFLAAEPAESGGALQQRDRRDDADSCMRATRNGPSECFGRACLYFVVRLTTSAASGEGLSLRAVNRRPSRTARRHRGSRRGSHRAP